jgi:pyruvate dehydrogenase E1 component alpha subunit
MSRTSPLSDLSVKAKGYGMAGDHFRGYDVLEVKERVGEAIARARRGDGPTFIEIETYRFRGHSMSDPGKYRSPEELEERKKNDPLKIAEGHLRKLGADDDQFDDVADEVDATINEAIANADAAAPASEETMLGTVYVGGGSGADA